MSSQAPSAANLESSEADLRRSSPISSVPYTAAASSSVNLHLPQTQRPGQQQKTAGDMLLSPSPAGHKLSPVHNLSGPVALQTPTEAKEQSESWEATSSKEEAGKKRQPCSFFLKTGNCAFGAECKFEHPLDQPATQYNSLGLPLRPGEPDCAYYVKNLHCGYGGSCKFHHAEPVIGWMPMMSENMSLHPSMMGYNQSLGAMPAAGLHGSYPHLQVPMMQQASPHMQMAAGASSLSATQQQYAAQLRPFMPLSMPMLLPHQQYMQMRLPGSPQLMPQPQLPQGTPSPGANPLLFQGMAQSLHRRDMRSSELAPAFAPEPSVGSRPSETGRSRRRGRGNRMSATASASSSLASNERTKISEDRQQRLPGQKEADLATSAFSAMSLEGRREA